MKKKLARSPSPQSSPSRGEEERSEGEGGFTDAQWLARQRAIFAETHPQQPEPQMPAMEVRRLLKILAKLTAILAVTLSVSRGISVADTTNTTWQVQTNTFTVSYLTSNRLDVITQTALPPTNNPPPVTNLAPVLVVLKASTVTPTGPFTCIATVTNTIPFVHHCEWFVDGVDIRGESYLPYSLFAKTGQTPNSGTLANGSHTIIARIFTNATLSFVSLPLTVTVSTPVVAAPSAPTNLVVTSVTSSAINLAWQDTSPALTSFFQVERADLDAGPWLLLASVPSPNSHFTDTGLPPSTTKKYRVRAGN